MERTLEKNIVLFYLHIVGRACLFFPAIYIAYQEHFLTFQEIAYFAAIVQIMIMIFELPTGVLADLISRRISMAIGVVLMGFGYFAILANSYPLMFLYSLLYGLGFSMISGADKALIFDTLKELKKEKDFPKIFATSSFVFQITATIAIVIGSQLYSINIHLPYLLHGVAIILSAIPALLLKEPDIDTYTFSLKNYIRQTKEGIAEAFKNAYIAKLSLLYLIIGGFSFVNHRFFAQKFMMEFGMDTSERSWVTAGIKLLVAFITIYVVSKKRIFDSKYFLLLLPIIMTITMIFIQYTTFPIVLFFLVGIAIPSGTRGVFVGHFLNIELNSKYRATALSAISMVVSIIYSLALFFGGRFIAIASVGEYYQIIGIGFLLIVIPLAISIIRTKKL